MEKKEYGKSYFPGADQDHRDSFYDGVESERGKHDDSAYYAGVGYEKGKRGVSLGFKSAEQYAHFARGVEEHHKHFISTDGADVKKPWYVRLFKWLFSETKSETKSENPGTSGSKKRKGRLKLRRETGKRYHMKHRSKRR